MSRGWAGSALLGLWFWAVIAFLFAPLAVVVVFLFNQDEVSILPIVG